MLSFKGEALEKDRKLIVRVLGLSSTKRTILLNKGKEDGVKIGDHAKFSNPGVGYFARGTVARVSPTRSVWSIYRIIKPEGLVENTVVTIKAASPVTLTKDETRALGILASSFEKTDEDPSADNGETNQLKDHLIQSVARDSSAFKGVDYSALFENSPVDSKEEEVDWRGVDGELDRVKPDEEVDFSTLNERFREL